jgi:hypothetical protein
MCNFLKNPLLSLLYDFVLHISEETGYPKGHKLTSEKVKIQAPKSSSSKLFLIYNIEILWEAVGTILVIRQ